MNKILTLVLLYLSSFIFGQNLNEIKSGEMLSYRIHYGFLTAGNASLTTLKTNYMGVPHFYVKGVGRTTGAVRAFFKVDDLYESFINLNTGLPSFYVRNVREGNYTQHYQTVFNHQDNTLILTDKEQPNKAPKVIKTEKGIQDMLSAFYFLRSMNNKDLKPGKLIRLNVWIDDEMFPFQLSVEKIENIDTKFGKINCLRIKPMVMSGRVFKAKEGVTMWVSNDKNNIPISMKAQLAVGSLKADLDNFSDVMYPLEFKK